MFHHERDASKVALVELVERMRDDGNGGTDRLLDVQWVTPHLESLGAIAVPVEEYQDLLNHALELPLLPTFVR